MQIHLDLETQAVSFLGPTAPGLCSKRIKKTEAASLEGDKGPVNEVIATWHSGPPVPVRLHKGCCCLGTRSCPTLCGYGLGPARLLSPWDSPVKNTRVGCHFLLQGIFLTQGSNLHLQDWQVGSLPLSHQGNPKQLYSSKKKL